MKFLIIANSEGGSLRGLDVEARVETWRHVLAEAGHDVRVRIVSGRDLPEALRNAAQDSEIDCVMAGGGDGTVSAAAGMLVGTQKALAILPAGTMNLFARSLGIPLDLDAAVHAFAAGCERRVDLASANGRYFVHQFSIGLHAKLVALRSCMAFSGRLGKMRASAHAAALTLWNPPRLRAAIETDGVTREFVTSGIGVANNMFCEGGLPVAEKPDGGVLAVYVTTALSRVETLIFSANMALGRWRGNPRVDLVEAREATVTLLGRHPSHGAIDGELIPLEKQTHFRIHPGALKVLVPAEREEE
jgi:diacylglycerol kinase family enzyme